jgi:hypothetical protein
MKDRIVLEKVKSKRSNVCYDCYFNSKDQMPPCEECVSDGGDGYNWQQVEEPKENGLELSSFIVVENNCEDLEQLSIPLESYEEAVEFRDDDYHKKNNPHAFIVATIKQPNNSEKHKS